MPIISIYPNITVTKGNQTIPIEVLIQNIQDGFWQDFVLPIRVIKDTEMLRQAKTHVPYVTISGVFTERNTRGLREHSNLIAIDIDDLGKDLKTIKQLLSGDPYSYAVFESISGRGLCCLVKIDGKRHEDAFNGLASYYIQKYQLSIDTACRDVSRPRYVSYDPSLYYNERSASFKTYLPKEKKKAAPPTVFIEDEFSELVSRMVKSNVSCTDDYRDWLRVGFGLAETLGERGRVHFHSLSAISGKYDTAVCDKQYSLCLKGRGATRVTLATVYWFAKQAGLDISSKKTKQIAAAATNLKRSGIGESDIIKSLEKFQGWDAASTAGVVKDVLSSNQDFTDEQTLVENMRMWVRQGYDIKRNLLTRKLEVSGQPLDEIDLNTMFLDCKIIFDKSDFRLFKQVLLSRNTPNYNPVRELIESIEWDGEERINSLAMCINSNTGSAEWRCTMFRRWYVGIVCAAYGFINELNFILVGGKNTGKTEFFRKLLPPELSGYFGASQLIRGKDDEILMCEKLIILNDEYGGKSKMDERNEKRIMAAHFFDLRVPYGTTNETIARLASLAGTCNDLDVLDDPTGNRRIIVMESAGKFDFTLYNSIDKYQLLAEAYAAYKAGERPKLTEENVAELEIATDGQYSKISFEGELIQQYFLPPAQTDPWDFMTTTQVKTYLENHTRDKLNINKLGAQLRKLGYTRTKEKGVYGYDIAPVPIANSMG